MAHDEILGGFRVRTNNGKGNRMSFDWLWCKWFFSALQLAFSSFSMLKIAQMPKQSLLWPTSLHSLHHSFRYLHQSLSVDVASSYGPVTTSVLACVCVSHQLLADTSSA